jgi:hypothetical protein
LAARQYASINARSLLESVLAIIASLIPAIPAASHLSVFA